MCYAEIIRDFVNRKVKQHYGVIGSDIDIINTLKVGVEMATFEVILFKPEHNISGKYLFKINYDGSVVGIERGDL